MNRAHELASARVALLPFADQTAVDGLSRALTDLTHRRLREAVERQRFEFTHLVELEPVYARVPVSALAELPAEEAVDLGRDLDATHVIRGRVFGARTATDSRAWQGTIYHRRKTRENGEWIETFEPVLFHATVRRRVVTLSYELEALDTGERESVAQRASTREAAAHTVFSGFVAAGDCDDYCLVAPALERAEPKYAEGIKTSWKESFGSWELPDLLERARSPSVTPTWGPGLAAEFRSATRPVFMDELPSERELALAALDDLWSEALEMMREIERR
jgi:hypothetical protein